MKVAFKFCVGTFIGNGKTESGFTSQMSDKKVEFSIMQICSNLLCSKCDCKVSMFKDMKWDNSCDYLFFRNNYGDSIKLSEVTFPLTYRKSLNHPGQPVTPASALGLMSKIILKKSARFRQSTGSVMDITNISILSTQSKY